MLLAIFALACGAAAAPTPVPGATSQTPTLAAAPSTPATPQPTANLRLDPAIAPATPTPPVIPPSATASEPAAPPQSTPTPRLALAQIPLGLEVAFPNLFLPRMVFLTPAGDGSNRLLVALQEGRIVVFPNEREVDEAQVFLDIRDRVDDGGNEEGLLGLALDPDFGSNGFFYVYYTASGPKRSVISRFSGNPTNPDRANPDSELVILEIPQPFSNHNGGHLLFGPDGFLYIGLGDGGSGGDPQRNGQNASTLLGSILRIDPGTPEGNRNYSVPTDNPFVGHGDFREEIWAHGLRNPWRFSFDTTGNTTGDHQTGDLWVGDVGQNSFEEVDRVLPGRNYGWNRMEGFHCFPASVGDCSAEGLELPVVEYPLVGRNCAVTGGYVYRGPGVPDLRGAYIYADFCSGRIWGLRHDERGVTDEALLLDSDLMIPSFAEDQQGELLILSFDGRIYRLR